MDSLKGAVFKYSFSFQIKSLSESVPLDPKKWSMDILVSENLDFSSELQNVIWLLKRCFNDPLSSVVTPPLSKGRFYLYFMKL